MWVRTLKCYYSKKTTCLIKENIANINTYNKRNLKTTEWIYLQRSTTTTRFKKKNTSPAKTNIDFLDFTRYSSSGSKNYYRPRSEGNVFTGVCHSVHNRPYGCLMRPLGHCVVGMHPTGMLSCFNIVNICSINRRINRKRSAIKCVRMN